METQSRLMQSSLMQKKLNTIKHHPIVENKHGCVTKLESTETIYKSIGKEV